jgi:hypothetical protein
MPRPQGSHHRGNLGYEAKYLGSATVARSETLLESAPGQPVQTTPGTVDIIRSKNEIRAGDRLLPSPEQQYLSYVPHAPRQAVDAAVVSIYGDSVGYNAAQNQVIAINKGLGTAWTSAQCWNSSARAMSSWTRPAPAVTG